MTRIHLCKMGALSADYSHVLDFDSFESRRRYFVERTLVSLEQNCQFTPLLQQLTVTIKDGLTTFYDYLWLEGEKITDDLFFFIIDENPYQVRNATTFNLQLDVFTTYWNHVTLESAFVERLHVNRWIDGKPNLSDTVDEGFPQYEYTICREDFKLMQDGYNGCYVFVASSPLGMITDGTGGGDEPVYPEGGGNCKATGVLSHDGFRFIKGYEGFTHTGSYLNGESFRTVGYGFTETSNPTGYEAHKPFPCSEEKASELYGELVDEYASRVWSQCQADGIADLLTYYMFDAMVSLAWNVGVGGFLTYDTSPYQLIRVNPLDPQIESVWKSFATTGGGVPMQGLVLRREAEANAYFTGNFEMRPIINTLDGGYVEGDGFIPSRYLKCNHMIGDLNKYEDSEGNVWALPLDEGYVTACYGSYPSGGSHYGIDFTHQTVGAIRGVNIYAPKDGMVVQNVVSGHNGDKPDGDGFGNYVTLYDPLTDSYHIFGHMLETPKVKMGQTVSINDVLGVVGTSGNSTGYHLHWEIRYHNNNSSYSVNPIKNAQINQWYYRKDSE